MPIYNRNSVGNVSVVANESYGYADMGRILSECVANDMVLFNTVIRNDFKENTAIREGTMVASEIQALREFSVKEAWEGLKAKLKKLWEKIKGVFKKVYAQLTVWLVRNGKAFVALHRKTLANKPGLKDIELPECYTTSSKYDAFIKSFDDLKAKTSAEIESNKGGSSLEVDVDKRVDELIGAAIAGADKNNAWEKAKELYFDKHEKGAKFGSIGVSVETLLDTISAGSKALKDIRKADAEADKSIRDVIKSLDKKARKEKEDTDESKAAAAGYRNASKACSAYERAMAITTKVAIKTVKFNVAQSRKIVGALVGGSVKEEVMLAIYEADEDVAEIEEIEGTPEEVADAIEDAKEEGITIEAPEGDSPDQFNITIKHDHNDE